jgi:hypothetical protein
VVPEPPSLISGMSAVGPQNIFVSHGSHNERKGFSFVVLTNWFFQGRLRAFCERKFLNITHMSFILARSEAMWQAYITLSEVCLCTSKKKGGPRNGPRRTHRVSGGIAQLFLNLGTRRGCVVSITLRPPGKTRYPLHRRLCTSTNK